VNAEDPWLCRNSDDCAKCPWTYQGFVKHTLGVFEVVPYVVEKEDTSVSVGEQRAPDRMDP
jgi:hypothetical protein